MAKLTAPLLSFGASGKIGNALVYSQWKGIPTAREYVTPANPQTAGQIAQRAILNACVLAWRSVLMTAAVRASWDLLASIKGLAMSGFNQFTSQMARAYVQEPGTSIVTAVAQTTAAEVQLTLKRLDDLQTGDENGNFTVLYGDAPDNLSNEYTATDPGGTLEFDATEGGFSATDVIYVRVRKAVELPETWDRCGIIEITLS